LSRRLRLPQNPNVVVRDNCVVICYLDGSRIVWGKEETHIDALRIARELEIELRAINYIKSQIKNFIQEMEELLYSVDADESLLLSIIKDGHSFAFREFDTSTSKALKLDAKPEIKQIIMKKMKDFYIV
jgi:hypothetical protein